MKQLIWSGLLLFCIASAMEEIDDQNKDPIKTKRREQVEDQYLHQLSSSYIYDTVTDRGLTEEEFKTKVIEQLKSIHALFGVVQKGVDSSYNELFKNVEKMNENQLKIMELLSQVDSKQRCPIKKRLALPSKAELMGWCLLAFYGACHGINSYLNCACYMR